jgi:hypothetical protein
LVTCSSFPTPWRAPRCSATRSRKTMPWVLPLARSPSGAPERRGRRPGRHRAQGGVEYARHVGTSLVMKGTLRPRLHEGKKALCPPAGPPPAQIRISFFSQTSRKSLVTRAPWPQMRASSPLSALVLPSCRHRGEVKPGRVRLTRTVLDTMLRPISFGCREGCGRIERSALTA